MNETVQPAVAGPVEPTVRPAAVVCDQHISGGAIVRWAGSAMPCPPETLLYTQAALDAAVAAERERLAREVAGLHMAQSVNNQNHPSAWHDAVDAALAVIRGA